MENNKPFSDSIEDDREDHTKKKTSKEKSLRELWDDLLSVKDQKDPEKTKPKSGDVLAKASKTDKETTDDKVIGVVETIPLDKKSEKSILLYPEESEENNTENELENNDASIETLGVIDHSTEEELETPSDWLDLESSIKKPPREELPSSNTENNNAVESSEFTAESSRRREKKPPQSEPQRPILYDQPFSYETFTAVNELSKPELTQVSVNPNESSAQNTETESSRTTSSTSEAFADRLIQWRHDREIKKIKAKQRRHTKRLRQVKLLQRKNRQELSSYRRENDKNLKHLNQERTSHSAKSSEHARAEVGATAPNKAARIDKDALPKEAQMIVEQLRLPAEHRLEHSAWHAIEVDRKTGHAVEKPAAITYGSEFKHEKHQEAWNQDSEEVAVASGQLAVGTVTDLGLGALSSVTDNLTPSGDGFKSTPSSNPLGINIQQSRLASTRAADPLLWIILGVIIVAIIAAVRG